MAIDGRHGGEGAYVTGELDGKLYGCPDRAPSFPANSWECKVLSAGMHYTYYLSVTEEMKGRSIKLHLIEMTEECASVPVSVYLCEANDCREGIVTEF